MSSKIPNKKNFLLTLLFVILIWIVIIFMVYSLPEVQCEGDPNLKICKDLIKK